VSFPVEDDASHLARPKKPQPFWIKAVDFSYIFRLTRTPHQSQHKPPQIVHLPNDNNWASHYHLANTTSIVLQQNRRANKSPAASKRDGLKASTTIDIELHIKPLKRYYLVRTNYNKMESTPRQEAKEEAESIAAAFAYVAASRKRDVGNLGGKENEADSNSTEPAAKQARKDDSDSSTASRGGKNKPPRIPHKTTNPEPSSARKSSSNSSTSVAAITPISARKGDTAPNNGSNSTGKDERQGEAGRRDENKENNQKLSPSASAASTTFSAKREDTSMVLSSIPLPSQIPNIFAPTPSDMATRTTTSCQCCSTGRHPDHPCFGGQCNSVNYLQTYGWEYRTLLRLKELEEYEPYVDNYEKDSSVEDPLLPLTVSGIVPPREKRRRQMTDWFHPHASQGWDLDDYMDRQPDLAPRMRSILIDWIVELTEEYKLSPNTFHLAVTLIDKSLACAKDGDDYLSQDEDEDDEDTDDQDSKANDERGIKLPRDMLQCLGW